MNSIEKVIEKKYGSYKEAVLQFGDGNFLHAFSIYIINKANESGVFNKSVVVSEVRGNSNSSEKLNAQNCMYTVITRGIKDSHVKEEVDVITSVSRAINPLHNFSIIEELIKSNDLKIIISNSTEAGIVFDTNDKLQDNPPRSFPAKLTTLLYKRYKHFSTNDNIKESDILILPTELIDYNGNALKDIVLKYIKLWQLEDNFTNWLNSYVYFANTLVDRIVSGYPKDESEEFEKKLGYKDSLMVTAEFYYLWVIEVEKEHEIRAKEIFNVSSVVKNVVWDNVVSYKQKKVRLLNGGHTSTVLAAYLTGYEYVLDFMTDELFSKFLKSVLFNEVIPSMNLNKNELESFALSVIERFSNPYIKHRLLDISLNSASKMLARLTPSITEYYKKTKKVPRLLAFSIASFILFYKGEMKDGKYIGKNYKGVEYEIRDLKEVIDFFNTIWHSDLEIENIVERTIKEILKIENVFGITYMVSEYIKHIEHNKDIRQLLKNIIY